MFRKIKIPDNPLIAEALYLAGYIERMGTGTSDIYRLASLNGLSEPKFIQAEEFKTIIYRPDYQFNTKHSDQLTDQLTDQPTDQPTDQLITEEIRRILILLEQQDRKRQELMDMLDLWHRLNFMDNYINPAVSKGLIELTEPNVPNHPNQKYRLTAMGRKQFDEEMSGKKKKKGKK